VTPAQREIRIPTIFVAYVLALMMWGAWACWKIHQGCDVVTASETFDFFTQEAQTNATIPDA
jgi:hypothetical protein